mmetsp:Transcript_7909/g.28895  ORF Transcript_7909/g.28895 Transcript_7909/m.28895 type:complete len:307 (-) Transcript_7909:193-1113(-)
MVAETAMNSSNASHFENLSALNTNHVKALIGQEVIITLGDASTRMGIVYTVDPVNFSVALLKPRRALIKGQPASAINLERDPLIVVPGHAIRGVEVVGGNQLAMEALTRKSFDGVRPVSYLAAGVSPHGRYEGGGADGGGRSVAGALAAASGGATYKENVGGSRGFGEFSSPASGGDFVSPVSSSRGGLSEDLSRLSTGAGANGGNGAAVYPPVGGRSANASSNSSRDRDDAAAIARMSRVRATLEAARVPVSEERSAKSGGAPGAHVSLVVMGCARLPFPYTADACECANEIVLSRVRELVASVQ